ncbi:MAG: hypothetical protein QXW79_00010 [Thermoplasmata archaeon]
MDNKLYTMQPYKNSWTLVRNNSTDNTCCVVNVYQLANGVFLGVGIDNRLYIRQNLTEEWKPVNSGNSNFLTCCVISVTQATDGTIFGVGTDNQLYTLKKDGDKFIWIGPIHTGPFLSISATSDGRLIALGTDHKIYEVVIDYNNLYKTSSDKIYITDGSVSMNNYIKSIYAFTNDIIIGIDTNNSVFVKFMDHSGWEGPFPNSCCVKSAITFH